MKNVLKSSQDPTKLSTTIKGGVMACSVLILAGMRMIGVPFTEADVVMVATQLGGVISGIVILYGIVWKAIMHFTEKQYNKSLLINLNKKMEEEKNDEVVEETPEVESTEEETKDNLVEQFV